MYNKHLYLKYLSKFILSKWFEQQCQRKKTKVVNAKFVYFGMIAMYNTDMYNLVQLLDQCLWRGMCVPAIRWKVKIKTCVLGKVTRVKLKS